MTDSNILIRHKLVDRLLHWVMALCVMILMATAFLPIYEIDFSWVTPHWITGVVLTMAILLHILRSLFWFRLKRMWFGLRDFKDTFRTLAWFFRIKQSVLKPGKYSPAQKMIHHAFSLVVLTAVVTGLLMMFKVDTPFWERDPYIFSSDTWGFIYVLHGFSSLFLITMIMVHIYFALRPEKRLYLRAMVFGWISHEEFINNHDPERWSDTNK